ncbi:MAG: hypothetical protein WCF90_02410 [Methanomicrobiales archaeon]
MINESVAIGRTDPDNPGSFDPENNLVLADGHTAVNWVSKPHGRFTRENKVWSIEDSGSNGETPAKQKKLRRCHWCHFGTGTVLSSQKEYPV